MQTAEPSLADKQQAAAKACDRMLQALLGYEPCRDLTIGDVKFISEWARTCAFDAIEDAIKEAAKSV